MTEAKTVVLFAADYVGHRITDFLCNETRADIAVLCLNGDDRGGFNKKIENIFLERFPSAKVLKDPDAQELEQALQGKAPHIGVLAWWPRILKSPLLGIPARGWINCHPSYLPFNQGKDPNFWCLVEESPAGATLHEVTAAVDQGPIIAQKKLPIDWTDTGETVYRKTRELAVELFRANFDRILRGEYDPMAQEQGKATIHSRKELEPASQIFLDRSYTGRELINILRARTFPPHPGAYFIEDGIRYSLELKITK